MAVSASSRLKFPILTSRATRLANSTRVHWLMQSCFGSSVAMNSQPLRSRGFLEDKWSEEAGAYAGSVLTFQQSSNVAGSSHAISEIGGQTTVCGEAGKTGDTVFPHALPEHPATIEARSQPDAA
jgi:hypothetical protein